MVVLLVVILYLLRRAGAESNVSTEAASIAECFSKAVNIPWLFYGEEYLQVLHFDEVTNEKCDRKEWRVFECNYPLMELLIEALRLADLSEREQFEYYNANEVEHYENAVKLMSQAIETSDELIKLVRDVKVAADIKNETRILNDNCSRYFFDMDELHNTSTGFAVYYEKLQVRLQIILLSDHMLQYYLPPFVILVFVCGMVGNGVLLLIFVRHPETRAGPNAMLVNLAISDTLFLICNIALDYCKKIWEFPFGEPACYFYTFFLTLDTGVSVYSMTMLSLSRYLAVSAKPEQRSRAKSTAVMLAVVWILSSIVAIPDTISTRLFDRAGARQCIADNRMLNALSDFFLISLLPLSAISWFYVVASRQLMKSARNMPGEAVDGQVKVKTARERGAKILPALAFVFAITYLPFYTLWAIITGFSINTDESPAAHVLFFIAYFLFNLNSTLNPVALYLASSMFKKYFNMYLCLPFKKKESSTTTLQLNNVNMNHKTHTQTTVKPR